MKVDPWPLSRYELISRTCALLVAGIGLAALIGWFTDSINLRGIRAGYIPMAPNTALIFLVLGLFFSTFDNRSQRNLVLVRAAAIVTILLVLIRLGEYLTGADFKVDHWFFQFQAESLGLAPVGKMAFFTAATFLLLGVALFLVTFLDYSWANNIAKVLAIVVAFMGLAFSLGYLYGAPLMYGGGSIPMALNTAIGFLIFGSAILVRASVTDISERRQAREAIRRAHDELEERVNDRTTELRRALASLEAEMVERKQAEETLQKTEDQLRQSQKLEAVGRLAGGVAHDFNNLLTIITGYSELLLFKKELDGASREKIEGIRNAGVRAASLTRQLLAFSRKQVLQPVVLDLNSLVEGVSKMLDRLIGEDIQITMALRPNIKRIHADPGQIEQVIVNLAVNARDAMPRGGKITIETANAELDEPYAATHVAARAGHYVMLSVSDTGVGMDAETQKQIFEPFFTTKEVGKGTGLGLSTVYGIVKQSGGNIWVYSEVNKGTSFKIYFPQVEGDAESLQTAHESLLPQGTETILLAEDENMVRALARENLSNLGYQVLEAGNGEEALKVSNEYQGEINLLLTDVVMPRMSGRELAERVAADRPGLPVLYMSGFTDDAIVHHGVLEPGTEFLEKPFTLNGLARKVRQVLDKHQEGGS
jgi:signal transduction histidine kinase/ActR/RegA family two-component response regulator